MPLDAPSERVIVGQCRDEERGALGPRVGEIDPAAALRRRRATVGNLAHGVIEQKVVEQVRAPAPRDVRAGSAASANLMSAPDWADVVRRSGTGLDAVVEAVHGLLSPGASRRERSVPAWTTGPTAMSSNGAHSTRSDGRARRPPASS